MRRLAFLLSLSLLGCDSGSGDGGSTMMVEGMATSVGRISGANVEVHAVGDNGAPQRLLGATTTGASGEFSLSVGYQGWTILKVWGGSYVDAATGSNATIPQATPLLGVAMADSSPVEGVVTRATTMLTMDAQEMARDPGLSFGDAVANAALKLQAISGVPNAHLTVPRNLMTGSATAGPEALYGALLAGYSEYAFNLGVSGPELGYAAAKDAKDGTFDGLEYFDPIAVNLSVNLAPGFLTFLGTFSQAWLELNPNNASGLGASDLPQLSALAAANNMLPSTPRFQGVWNGHSPRAGGNTVTVRGWGFGTAPQIFVGATQVTADTASDTEFTFTTPAFSTAGDRDLSIRVGLGYTYTSKAALRYYDENAAPTVTETKPNEGGTTGGTPVTITGTNLDPLTRVFFGPDEGTVVAGTFPRQIVVTSPKVSAPGVRDVRIENGAGQSVTLSGRYEYKKKDVGRTFDESYLDGGFSAIFQKWDFVGNDFRATVGRSAWQLDGSGQGTFTRTQTTMLESGTTEESASGQAFATAEGHNGQVLTVDAGTNATNLYAFTIDPGGRLGAGLTAGGTVSMFKHGTGLSDATLSGKYGVSGSYVHVTPELTFGFGAGTIEFDGAGSGGLNMKVYERDSLGTSFRQYTLVMPLEYDVGTDGALDVRLDPDATIPWDLQGRVTSDGSFASFYYAGTGAWQGRSAAFKVLKLEPGTAPEDYCGEYDGGYMTEKAFDDGVDIVPKATSYLSYRLLETDGFESRHFSASDGGSLLPGPIDRIYQTGRVSERVLGQYGRVEHLDGSVGGFLSPKLGFTISVGKLAETTALASLGDRLEYGLGVEFLSHYSKWSVTGTHNLLSWTSRWVNPTTPITGDESNETSIGSIRFNPGKLVTIGGGAYSSFGGFDDYTASAKHVNRTGLSVSATFGPPTDFDADFAYGFLNDRFHYVIGERDPAGALGGFGTGFTIGKGVLSPSGGLGGYGSTSGYDRTSFTAFAPQRSWTIGPSYRFGTGFWGFNPATGATLGSMERGTISVSGMTVMQNYMQRLFTEGAAGSATSSGLRSGTFVQHPDGKADFALGGQIYGGIAIGDADMFLLTDFTNNNQTGIQILTKNALSTPPIFDYGLAMFSKLFLDTNLPALTSLTSRAATYTPNRNLLSFVARDDFRANNDPTTGIGRQINTGTASADATGGSSINLGAAALTGGLTGDGCLGFVLPGPSNEAPNAMTIGIMMNF